MKDVYVADFETCDNRAFVPVPSLVRVWLWAVASLDKSAHFYGRDIESFIEHVQTYPGTYYFHNLAFDGTHILDYLLRNGWGYAEPPRRRKQPPRTFSTLISDKGKFYCLRAGFETGEVEFRDSLKKLPFSVSVLGKTWGTEDEKGSIDYTRWRGADYVPSAEEMEYIRRDVDIVADSLSVQIDQGYDSLTIGSDCMKFYKELTGKKTFDKLFPKLNMQQDTLIRRAYRGGYVRCAPEWAGVDVYGGISVDRNSMYPSEMRYRAYPVGKPRYFSGKYKPIPDYPLYVQTLTCTFRVKPGGLPTIQLKNGLYGLHEYVERCDEPTEITLCNVDLDIFFENYDVQVYDWSGGFCFHAEEGLFSDYIDYWMNIKATSTGALRQLAKLFLTIYTASSGRTPLWGARCRR